MPRKRVVVKKKTPTSKIKSVESRGGKKLKETYKTKSVKSKQVTKNGKVTKTVTRKRGSGSAAVDGESWGTKGRSVTKSTPKKTVSKTKSKGTGWANPIKKINDKKVTKGGVTKKNKKSTTYKSKSSMAFGS